MPDIDRDEALRNYPLIVLALLIWRESRGESDEGRLAVGCTVRERAYNNARYDGTEWISAMTRKWQYSSISAPGDLQLIKWPAMDDVAFHRCLEIADEVIGGYVEHPAPTADSYFDDSISPPSWATPDRFIKKIGRLNFYRINS